MPTTDLLLAGTTVVNDPVRNDGDVASFILDTDGRLRVSSKQAPFVEAKGDLTTAAQTLPLKTLGVSSILMHAKNTGSVTMAAGAFTFEGSLDSTDGTDGTWFGVQAVRTNANTVELLTPALGIAAGVGLGWAYRMSVAAYKYFRIRCSTTCTASSIATWTITPESFATEPVPAIQTHAVTTTGTATTTPVTPTNYGLISAATTNAAVIKASAAQLLEIAVFNPTAAIIYIKLYNKTTAPTVGTDIPIISFPVPINGTVAYEFGPNGKKFVTGMSLATTLGPLATDVAAIAVGAQISASYI